MKPVSLPNTLLEEVVEFAKGAVEAANDTMGFPEETPFVDRVTVELAETASSPM
jgi:hypothetical protein